MSSIIEGGKKAETRIQEKTGGVCVGRMLGVILRRDTRREKTECVRHALVS